MYDYNISGFVDQQKTQKTKNVGGQQGHNSGFDISYKIYILFVKFVYQQVNAADQNFSHNKERPAD